LQLRDLTLACVEEFQTFAPGAIQELLRGLSDAGFIEGLNVRLGDEASPAGGSEIWPRSLRWARRIVQFEISVQGVDPFFTAAYHKLFWLLFTKPAYVAGAALSAAGAILFLREADTAANAVEEVGAEVLLLLIPAQFLAVVVHEAAHAFSVKRFRREVWRVGFGWYWFGPMAFVDTSDMWLAPKWPRLATSMAGPAADLLTGGLFGLIAAATNEPLLTAAAWQVSLTCFVVVLLNLNPLLEYDGYYALVDLLDRPNLRYEAMSWLGDLLRKPSAARLKGHRVDALYSVASCAFILIMAVLTVVTYRLFAQRLIDHLAPHAVAAGLAFVLAAVVCTAAGASLVGDVFGDKTLSRAGQPVRPDRRQSRALVVRQAHHERTRLTNGVHHEWEMACSFVLRLSKDGRAS